MTRRTIITTPRPERDGWTWTRSGEPPRNIIAAAWAAVRRLINA